MATHLIPVTEEPTSEKAFKFANSSLPREDKYVFVRNCRVKLFEVRNCEWSEGSFYGTRKDHGDRSS